MLTFLSSDRQLVSSWLLFKPGFLWIDLSYLMQRANSLEKTLMLGKTEGKRKRGVAEDEMVTWHHWLNGHEFKQTLGESRGQRSLACYSPWSHRVRHDLPTEQHTYMICWLFSGGDHSGLFAYRESLLIFSCSVSLGLCPGISSLWSFSLLFKIRFQGDSVIHI